MPTPATRLSVQASYLNSSYDLAASQYNSVVYANNGAVGYVSLITNPTSEPFITDTRSRIEFNLINVAGQATDLTLRIGLVDVAVINFPLDYIGHMFRFYYSVNQTFYKRKFVATRWLELE